MQRLLARVPRLVADFDPAQPLDAGHALHARHQQPQRIALLRAQHLAVLAVGDDHVVERHLDGHRARQRRAVGALGQDEFRRLAVDADLVEQRRQQDAGPLAAGEHAVRELHRRHRDVAPLHAGVGAALDEVDARHRREADDVVHREHPRGLDHAVHHQPVLERVDVRNPRVVPLEMQARRRDDAEQVLQRRERDRRMRRAREPRALAPAHVGLELATEHHTAKSRTGAPSVLLHSGTRAGLSWAPARAGASAAPAATTPPDSAAARRRKPRRPPSGDAGTSGAGRIRPGTGVLSRIYVSLLGTAPNPRAVRRTASRAP